MGFFADLKEDLSQAVNELMPEEETSGASAMPEGTVQAEGMQESPAEPEGTATEDEGLVLEQALQNIDSLQLAQASEETLHSVDAEEAAALVEESFAETAAQEETQPEKGAADSVREDLQKTGNGYTPEKVEGYKGAEKKMESYSSRTEETSIITAGMVITGDISSEGSMEVIGSINGNIDILGTLNVTGYITGNSKAAEIYAEGAKINGEIVSEGDVKIGASSVVIGNITASSAVIAGAVKGDIDVKGPVVLDASAIVMGNIKSKSVQINNGAVIEGMCSQCYADISPLSFFEEYKPEIKKGKSK